MPGPSFPLHHKLHRSMFLLLTVSLFSNWPARFALAEEPAGNQRLVIAYLPEYRFAGFTLDRLDGLTDLVLFSIEPRPSGELDASRLKAESIRKIVAACREKNVRVTIALGGWERSRGFAKLAGDPESRQRFAENLTKYCVDNQLAGADFDWEHPHGAAEEK